MVIVFGGSFNPPTIAHLKIVKQLLKSFENAQVLILPVGDDYKKENLVAINHRIEMLKLLTKDLMRVIISNLESKHQYRGTLASLKKLKQMHSNLAFAIGADQLKNLKAWIDYKELLATYQFIVMTRKNSLSSEEANKMFAELKHDFVFINFDQNISSSEVRMHKEMRKTHLTKEVYNYIENNNLYKE